VKILIVDDEETIAGVLGDFLTDCGHSISSSANGVEALKAIEVSSDTDLILSDIRMPIMDGIHLLKAMRVRHPGVPVMLMTGHGDESVAMSALREGAHGYLKKPIKLDELLAAVEQVEERKQLENSVFEEYKTLYSGDGLPRIRRETSDHAAEILTCVNAVCGELGNLDELYRTLSKCRRESKWEFGELTFLVDEMPSMLASIKAELNTIQFLAGSKPNDSP
jgi:DNA-binding response OmpR family regulator